ncbi:hypothetical protein JKP88DRAFT_242342 [Tribonema minus]|uniref:monodehydroascorbate reductase (NADH) n=1 Tax=Tribonema minus TaxID=303371 RepID=A0A835YL95_9STRA|nr:hypothetical protein JKP88DRAFT_242342 [Tribonema minus]
MMFSVLWLCLGSRILSQSVITHSESGCLFALTGPHYSGSIMKEFDMVCLGGGVVAGYWAEACVELIEKDPLLKKRSSPLKLAIVTSYPEGIYPYERPACSKELLDPALTLARDPQAKGSSFPLTGSLGGREGRGAKWYKANNITFYWGCQCTAVNADAKELELAQWLDEKGKRMDAPKPRQVKYGKLLVATGSAPAQLQHVSTKGGIPALSGCYCLQHPDVKVTKIDAATEANLGHGTLHYLRDIADCTKLVKALSSKTVTPAGQEDEVLVVGSSFLAVEAVCAMVQWYPHVKPVMLVRGSHIMEGFLTQWYPHVKPVMLVRGSHVMQGFLTQELADVYENELEARGVKLMYNADVQRMWLQSECGRLNTLDGVQKRIVERHLMKRIAADRCRAAQVIARDDARFKEVRGVVASVKGGMPAHIQGRRTKSLYTRDAAYKFWLARSRGDVRMPVRSMGRIVVVCAGSVPNTAALRGVVTTAKDGGILVDSALLSSKRDIYAAGDVASFPLSCEDGIMMRNVASFPLSCEDGAISRSTHVHDAREMARVAARNMALAAAAAQFTPVPMRALKFLKFSWTFYGVAEGEVAVLGLDEYDETESFGAFWVRKGEVVGAFLEGGNTDDIKAIEKIATERPKVANLASLLAMPLASFLQDPHSVQEVRAAGAPNPDALTLTDRITICCRCM